MADYAFADSERTIRIEANHNNNDSYKGVRLYCRNPKCNARMFVHNPGIPGETYFQSHGKPSHVGYCGCPGVQHFNRNEYAENEFFMPDAIASLMIADNQPGDNPGNHARGDRVNLHPPRTARQIYQMCVNTPPDDMYNGIYIHDILAGEDTKQYYNDGINGYRLLECTFYKYNANTLVITVNFPFDSWERNVELWFTDQELFEYATKYLQDKTHKCISLVAGNFTTHPDGTIYTNIVSKKQLYRFR